MIKSKIHLYWVLSVLTMPIQWLAYCNATSVNTDSDHLTFEAQVRPILKAACFHCHGEDSKFKGDLDLRLRHLILEGGKHGPAIMAGQPNKSLLLQNIRNGKMPKGQAKLTDEDIARIGEWIAQGAKTARPEPEDPDAVLITEEERNFWLFQPIKNPPIPEPISRIVHESLEASLVQFVTIIDSIA